MKWILCIIGSIAINCLVLIGCAHAKTAHAQFTVTCTVLPRPAPLVVTQVVVGQVQYKSSLTEEAI